MGVLGGILKGLGKGFFTQGQLDLELQEKAKQRQWEEDVLQKKFAHDIELEKMKPRGGGGGISGLSLQRFLAQIYPEIQPPKQRELNIEGVTAEDLTDSDSFLGFLTYKNPDYEISKEYAEGLRNSLLKNVDEGWRSDEFQEGYKPPTKVPYSSEEGGKLYGTPFGEFLTRTYAPTGKGVETKQPQQGGTIHFGDI